MENDMEKPQKIEITRLVVIVLGCCVSIVATVFLMGRQTGHAENKIKNIDSNMTVLQAKVEMHDTVIEEMRREAAYQKGVVNTKLDNMERSIKTIEANVQKLLENLQLVEEWYGKGKTQIQNKS